MLDVPFIQSQSELSGHRVRLCRAACETNCPVEQALLKLWPERRDLQCIQLQYRLPGGDRPSLPAAVETELTPGCPDADCTLKSIRATGKISTDDTFREVSQFLITGLIPRIQIVPGELSQLVSVQHQIAEGQGKLTVITRWLIELSCQLNSALSDMAGKSVDVKSLQIPGDKHIKLQRLPERIVRNQFLQQRSEERRVGKEG